MSEIAERIQFNARRSAEYCDGVVLSDASIDQIIQAETGYEKEIDALRSRIAELEKSAVVWHRYTEEKPEPDTRHLVVVNGNVHISRYDAEQDIDKINVTHWAYLPATPEEVSND